MKNTFICIINAFVDSSHAHITRTTTSHSEAKYWGQVRGRDARAYKIYWGEPIPSLPVSLKAAEDTCPCRNPIIPTAVQL